MINEESYYIYEHINKINKKIYIGITKKENPEDRWENGEGYISNKDFYNDIQKYGWNNFEHNILLKNISSKMLAEEIESVLIYKLNTVNPDIGYNLICNSYSYGCLPEKTIKRYKNPNSKKCIFDGMEFESMSQLISWLYKNNFINWIPCSSIVRKWIDGINPLPPLLKNKELRIVE